jgi:hypothetical protein
MALFGRVNKAAIATEYGAIEVTAAVGASNVGSTQIGNYVAYQDGTGRERMMSLAVIARARDLICTTIGGLQLEMYREMWNGDDMEEVPLAPRSWLARMDKTIPNSTLLSWLADDLIFWGRAFLYVTERTADGYPSNYTRLPSAMCQTLDQQGSVYFGPSNSVMFNGLPIEPRDLIQFISPMQGILFTGRRTSETAIRIEEARMRNASSAIPAGVLKQTGGEPLSGQELADLAAQFNLARATNQTAALNEFLSYTETNATPDKMLLIDSADYSARDLGRLLGVPSYLLSVSIGAYSYQSAQQSRMDLWQYACKPIADCITQTLSSDNNLPKGTMVKFDVDDFLSETYMGGDIEEPSEMMPDPSTPQSPMGAS